METKLFADWILQVGDGVAGGDNDGEIDIKIPDDLLIRVQGSPITSIVQSMYPSLLHHISNTEIDTTYFNN